MGSPRTGNLADHYVPPIPDELVSAHRGRYAITLSPRLRESRLVKATTAVVAVSNDSNSGEQRRSRRAAVVVTAAKSSGSGEWWAMIVASGDVIAIRE
ncbi:hypothetical protein GW17_00008021 [Ensete ventricosum]|nr:hypothetical protein GW17_00008021 [Ensete ventricosum]